MRKWPEVTTSVTEGLSLEDNNDIIEAVRWRGANDARQLNQPLWQESSRSLIQYSPPLSHLRGWRSLSAHLSKVVHLLFKYKFQYAR